MQGNMRRRVLIAKNWLLEPYGACSLLMDAPIRNAFDCSSRKPMRRHFVSGFPRALLSLSQKMSSGVEIDSPSYEITACAPNRRRVAATCFASSTHGATCRRDMSLRLVA